MTAAEEPVPVLTVCEALKDIEKYDGKTIIVFGRFASSMEGGWLSAGMRFHGD